MLPTSIKKFLRYVVFITARIKEEHFGQNAFAGDKKSFFCAKQFAASIRMPTKIGFASNTVQYSTYFSHIYPPSLFLQGLSCDPLYILAPTSLSLSLLSREIHSGRHPRGMRRGRRKKKEEEGRETKCLTQFPIFCVYVLWCTYFPIPLLCLPQSK